MNKKIRLLMLLILIFVFSLVVFREGSVFSSLQLKIEDMINNQSDEADEELVDEEPDENVIEEKFKVVIDPGHGGKDVGAQGVSGKYEKDFTLSLSEKVKNLLDKESHIVAFMTRSDDRFLSRESLYRPKFANKLKADLFVSIHGNTFEDATVSGTEVFYYHNNSRMLAEILQKHVVEATGFRDRGAKKEDFFVLTDTEMPSALIEVGYLTNPEDESKMWDDDFQNKVAMAIVEGIKEYIDGNL